MHSKRELNLINTAPGKSTARVLRDPRPLSGAGVGDAHYKAVSKPQLWKARIEPERLGSGRQEGG